MAQNVNTIAISINSYGRQRPIAHKFPEWVLRRFSGKSKDEYHANKAANRPYQVLRLNGPLSNAAVKTVMHWMLANKSDETGTPLHPKNLSFFQRLTVLQAAREFRVIPAPIELKKDIMDHIAATPLHANEFIFIANAFAENEGMQKHMAHRTVEFFISGALDDEIEEIHDYTEHHSSLERELENLVTSRVEWMRRAAKRQRKDVVPGLVHAKWREDTDESSSEASADADVETSFNSSSSTPELETEEAKLQRRDSARHGYGELNEDDVDEILKQGVGNVKFNSKKGFKWEDEF